MINVSALCSPPGEHRVPTCFYFRKAPSSFTSSAASRAIILFVFASNTLETCGLGWFQLQCWLFVHSQGWNHVSVLRSSGTSKSHFQSFKNAVVRLLSFAPHVGTTRQHGDFSTLSVLLFSMFALDDSLQSSDTCLPLHRRPHGHSEFSRC